MCVMYLCYFFHPFLQTSASMWLQNFEFAGYPRCVFIYGKDNFFFHIFIQDSEIVSNIKKTNMYCRYILNI